MDRLLTDKEIDNEFGIDPDLMSLQDKLFDDAQSVWNRMELVVIAQDAKSVKEERQAVGNYINEYCVNMNHPGHETGHERIRRYQCRLCMLALSKRLRQGYASEIVFDGQEDNTQ